MCVRERERERERKRERGRERVCVYACAAKDSAWKRLRESCFVFVIIQL